AFSSADFLPPVFASLKSSSGLFLQNSAHAAVAAYPGCPAALPRPFVPQKAMADRSTYDVLRGTCLNPVDRSAPENLPAQLYFHFDAGSRQFPWSRFSHPAALQIPESAPPDARPLLPARHC